MSALRRVFAMAWRFCSRDCGEAFDVLHDARDALRIDGAHHRIDIGRQGLELLGQGPDLLGRLPDLGQEAVDALGILAESLREALHVLDRPADGAFVVGHHAPDPLQDVVSPPRDVARSLDQILEVGTVGEDRRHGLAGPCRQRRSTGLSTGEADIRDTRQALIFQAGPRIGPDRGAAVDLDDGDDPARILREKADIGDVTDPQAVEGDARALGETGDRAREHDSEALARLTPLAAGEPVDEAEGRRDHRQGEEPDQGVICTRFHRYPYAPPAMTARARFP